MSSSLIKTFLWMENDKVQGTRQCCVKYDCVIWEALQILYLGSSKEVSWMGCVLIYTLVSFSPPQQELGVSLLYDGINVYRRQLSTVPILVPSHRSGLFKSCFTHSVKFPKNRYTPKTTGKVMWNYHSWFGGPDLNAGEWGEKIEAYSFCGDLDVFWNDRTHPRVPGEGSQRKGKTCLLCSGGEG